jgi:hypothetical protein
MSNTPVVSNENNIPSNSQVEPNTCRSSTGEGITSAPTTFTEPFTLQRDQRYQAVRGKLFAGSKRQPVNGTSRTVTTIQGVLPNHPQQTVPKTSAPRSVYIGRLSSSVSCASIRKHLQESGISGITDVIDLKCRTVGQSSFCVVADGTVTEDALYNASLWPQGARIRPYEEKQSSVSQSTTRPRSNWNRSQRQTKSASPPVRLSGSNPPVLRTVTPAQVVSQHPTDVRAPSSPVLHPTN